MRATSGETLGLGASQDRVQTPHSEQSQGSIKLWEFGRFF